MDLFDKKGGLQDTVGAHPTRPIPDALSWDKMGAGILAGVEKRKKKRRLLIWWWGGGLSLLGLSLVLFFSQNANNSIEALPIPQNSEIFNETTEKINQLANNKEIGIQDAKEVKIAATKEIVKKNVSQKTVSKYEEENALSYQKEQKNPLAALAEQEKRLLERDSSISNKIVSQNVDSQALRNRMESLLNLPVITSLLEVEGMDEIIPVPVIPVNEVGWNIAISGGTNWWQYGDKMSAINEEAIPTTLNGWQGDLRISRAITKKLSIKTGVGIQQLRFRSNYEAAKEVLVYQPNTIDTIITSSLTGQQTFIYSDSIPAIQTRNFQHHNRHTSFQIPLLLSYQIRKQRWTLAFQTGVAIQVLSKSKGRLAMSNGTITDLEDTDIYTKNIRWSYLLETEIGYRTTRNLTIFARYGLENHLTNWIEKDFSYLQKPKVMSLNMGISYKLD